MQISQIEMLCNRPHKWGSSIIANIRHFIAGVLAKEQPKEGLRTFNFTVHYLEQVRQELINQIFEELKQSKKTVPDEELFESVIICELKLHQDYINHFMRPVLQRDFSNYVFKLLAEVTRREFDNESQQEVHLNSMKIMSEHPNVTSIIDLVIELESLLHKVTLLYTYKNGISNKISVMMLYRKALNKELIKEPILNKIICGVLGAGFKQAETAGKANKQSKDLDVWRLWTASIMILDVIGYIVQPHSSLVLLWLKSCNQAIRENNINTYEEFLQTGGVMLQDNKRTTAVMIEVRNIVQFHLEKRLKPFNELLCEYIQGVLDGKWSAIEKNFESNLQWFFQNPNQEVDPVFLKMTFKDVKVGDEEYVLVDSLDLNSNTPLKDMKTSFFPPKKPSNYQYDI